MLALLKIQIALQLMEAAMFSTLTQMLKISKSVQVSIFSYYHFHEAYLFQFSVDRIVSVLIGHLFPIIYQKITSALCFHRAKRGQPIHIQTKSTAETRPASQSPSNVASVSRGVETTPPTATAGVCMEARSASSRLAQGWSLKRRLSDGTRRFHSQLGPSP